LAFFSIVSSIFFGKLPSKNDSIILGRKETCRLERMTPRKQVPGEDLAHGLRREDDP
jgi:hypothetical protein